MNLYETDDFRHNTDECSVIALGRRLRPLERISTVGRLLCLSRSSAYRLAASDKWPLVGPENSRWVLMIPLLERYGIPHELEVAQQERVEEEQLHVGSIDGSRSDREAR